MQDLVLFRVLSLLCPLSICEAMGLNVLVRDVFSKIYMQQPQFLKCSNNVCVEMVFYFMYASMMQVAYVTYL